MDPAKSTELKMDGKLQQFAREMFQSGSAFRDLYCELGEGELGIYFTVLQTTARSLCAVFFCWISPEHSVYVCSTGQRKNKSRILQPVTTGLLPV